MEGDTNMFKAVWCCSSTEKYTSNNKIVVLQHDLVIVRIEGEKIDFKKTY